MTERFDLLIGGVVATRASIICVPTDCGAGRRLRVVMDNVVTERGDVFRLGIGMTVIGSGVRFYARYRTGRFRSNFVRDGRVIEFNVRIIVRADVFRLRRKAVPNKFHELIIVSRSGDHGRLEGDLGFSVYVDVIQSANGAYVIRRIAGFGAGRFFVRHVFQSRIIMVVYRRLDIGRHDPDVGGRHRKGVYLTFCHRDHVIQRNDQLARTPAGRRYKDHSVVIPRLDLDDDPVLYDDSPIVPLVIKENAGNIRIIFTGIKVDFDRIGQRANDIIAFH